jgi:hypothetical protein
MFLIGWLNFPIEREFKILVGDYIDCADITLLIYLCGTTTNTWLRPVEEHLSMSASPCAMHMSTMRAISDP